jgi:Zn-dependent protease with chaperone function
LRFFARQVEATRSGRRLLLRFALTTTMAAALAGASVALAVSALAPSASPAVLALAAGASASLALVAALFGVLRLRRRLSDGGIAVARLLGARAVVPDPIDPAERRLCDVARETAIAAGTQVPMLCLLDSDPSINACAAGRTPGDAVVIFTRGAVEQMSREELQGVFAHALAHILHGDVRPAFMLGEFAGGLRGAYDAGLFLLRAPAGTARVLGPARRRRARQALLRAAGAVLAGAGSLGLLAALSMQAGAGRRRALRADATAIRITRVPEALASALRKAQRPEPAAARAASLTGGGAGADPARMRALTAHGWFVAPERRARPFVTHPPIPERIRRIAGRSLLANAPPHSGPVSDRWPLRWHVAAAAVRRPTEARAVALALLAPGRAAELRLPGARDVFAIAPDSLPSAARQALLELAAATLRNEPPDARMELLREARRLVEADARVTLLEFVFYLTLVDRIGEGSGIARARTGAVARLRARRLRDWAAQGLVRWRRTQGGSGEPVDASAALALLIRAALDWHRSRLPRSLRSLTRAFERASAYWGWSLWSPPGALDARELIAAIRVIALLQTLDQARAVKALAAALLGDRNTHPDARAAQAAVLRALCFAWGVPLPPSRGRVSKREQGDAFAGTPTLVYLDA